MDGDATTLIQIVYKAIHIGNILYLDTLQLAGNDTHMPSLYSLEVYH